MDKTPKYLDWSLTGVFGLCWSEGPGPAQPPKCALYFLRPPPRRPLAEGHEQGPPGSRQGRTHRVSSCSRHPTCTFLSLGTLHGK